MLKTEQRKSLKWKSQTVLAIEGEGGNVHEPQTPFQLEAQGCFFAPFQSRAQASNQEGSLEN